MMKRGQRPKAKAQKRMTRGAGVRLALTLLLVTVLSGLVTAAPNPPSPPNAPTAMNVVRYGGQKFAELNMQGQSVELSNCEISGPLVADVVVLRQSKVYGQVTARRVEIDGGIASGGIKADSIYITSAVITGDMETKDLSIGDDAAIRGNVKAQQGVVVVRNGGIVDGNIEAAQLRLEDGATVNGSVKVESGNITFAPGAVVNGKVIGPADGIKLNFTDSSGRSGMVNMRYNPPQQVVYGDRPGKLNIATMLGLWLPVLFGMLSLSAILFAFFSFDVETVADAILDTPLRFLWAGTVSMILTAAVTFLLFITIIGIPLGVAAAITSILVGAVGLTGVNLAVGAKVLPLVTKDARLTPFVQLLAGAFMVTHLAWIPILGWLLLLALSIMGYGAAFAIWWPRIRGWWGDWRRSRRERKALRNAR